MSEALSTILGLSQQWITIGFIVFLRIGAASAVLPAFGEKAVPLRIRLVLALAFTAIVAPAVSETIGSVQTPSAMLLLTEVVAGLALGLSVRLFVLALQIAGSIAAQSTSLSQIFGNSGLEPQPAIGHLLLVAGLALATLGGLHIQIAGALVTSYSTLPVGEWADPAILSEWGVMRVSSTFSLGFTLAAPFVIASMIYNLAMGVINKAMPQLMVAFVGAPAITAGGLILLLVSMPMLMGVWLEALNIHLANPFMGKP